MRTLSYTEISTAMTCQARWDFKYGGHLAGGHTFSEREIAAKLSDGRAWGAAVAAWHASQTDDSLFIRSEPFRHRWEAHLALRASYSADVIQQREAGYEADVSLVAERSSRIGAILDHYMVTAEKLPNLEQLEGELDVPVPSRTGKRGSSRYRFQAFVDGIAIIDGRLWVVEFKLRDKLTPLAVLQLSRQIRWYAWAKQQELGEPIAGIVVDERLNEIPKPARLVNAKRKAEGIDGRVPSHAKDQVTTADSYVALCLEYNEDPHPDVVEALSQRKWQQRYPIPFRPSELEEAGRELTSAAKVIRDLDSGEFYPVRNAAPHICGRCQFKGVCSDPTDLDLVQTAFALSEPKRLRAKKEAVAA